MAHDIAKKRVHWETRDYFHGLLLIFRRNDAPQRRSQLGDAIAEQAAFHKKMIYMRALMRDSRRHFIRKRSG